MTYQHELKNICLIISSINNFWDKKKVFISLQEMVFAVFLINKTPGRAFTLAAKWRHVIVIYKKKEIEDIDVVHSYLFSVYFTSV